MSFYIQKIIVSGLGKTDSIIELSNGVNIIYGPSNTGKTCIVKCIDYMFGSERVPIDISTGYQHVKIIVKTQCGTITMSREIGQNNIEVYSDDKNILSGKYATKASRTNYDKTINAVWLSLIGIDDMHLIISNENFKKQLLSWRIFSHMFVLTETKIISECSSILSGHVTANTAVISSLIFLLTGQDFAETEVKDSKEIKEAKKNAVKSYINKDLFWLSERNQELISKLKGTSDRDIQQELEEIMSRISEYEQKLNESIEENQKILGQLHEKNENLSECNVLINRYAELTTQYDSDLKRLNFIVDGEANLKDEFPSHCPFCEGKMNVSKSHDYIDAAKADYKKIKLQAKDLEKASQELHLEKHALEHEIEELMAKKHSTEEIIEVEIKPQLDTLKDKLSLYKSVVEYQNEIEVLKKISEQKVADMIDNESEDESDLKFKAKEHLDYSFINDLTEEIKIFLEECQYENVFSLTFDKADMDIVINGKKKSSNGKGYNAYFNSAVSIVLSRYMNKNAKFPPNFLVLDSPILSLKEKETKKPSETMRYSLFQNIICNQGHVQTVIVENEIPDIDYKNATLIRFTKEKGNGRYGFLSDVTD